MDTSRYRKIIYWLLPLLGIGFCLWYVKNATCDVVYSDYIRLVNSYLPDVYDPGRFFVPDVLTRIPINITSSAAPPCNSPSPYSPNKLRTSGR